MSGFHGFQTLEYRSYDSAGMTGLSAKGLVADPATRQ